MGHPALPTWPEAADRKRRIDPVNERLDQGLKDMWETEDHSVDDLDRIREIADS